MAELVGAVLSSFLQVAFDRLASHETIHYFQTRGLDQTLVIKLKIMLISINSVIDDAECRQFSHEDVKAWLCELKDVVYDAEDVLDEVNYQVSKQKMEAEADAQTSISSKVWKRLSASTGSFDQEIETRMKEVLARLEDRESRMKYLGLKPSEGGAVGSVTRLTTSLVDEDGIYGRDKDKEFIISQLLNDKHFSVISIVGEGGLGKTTLAQIVCNDGRIKKKFDIPAVWVCVSDNFDVLRLTKIISKKIGASKDDIEDLDTLQNKLKDKLSGKKFLIVLDDVWSHDCDAWEALLKPFNICGAAGSRILVTSRKMSVALAAPSDESYRLFQLSNKDSWLLFEKYAFRNSCLQKVSDLEEIGRKIVEKCKGLPLALRAIGRVLCRKSSWEEWNSILISEFWRIKCENILPTLMLSYHDLPSHIKRCFAYCSLFPKDYEFKKEKLVALWMAQNFLQASQWNSIEDAGNEAFQELVSRSFFQKSSEKETHFVMHDLVNDLAIFVAGDFCFKQEAQEVPHISKKTRHLSFLVDVLGEQSQFEYLQNIKKLRTFLPLLPGPSCIFYRWTSSDLFGQLCKCKYLRFLSLASNPEITEIPDSIRDLMHLRHLDLSDSKIKRLPESICLLYNLQTLKLANCRHLDELPTGLHKLKNLRQLDLRNTGLRKIPPILVEMKNLQVCLSTFYGGECSEMNIKQIGDLNLKGELSIYELHNVVDSMDALKANLKEKKHLEELCFQWNENNDDNSENERDVLEKLQPHRNLKKLSIRYYGDTKFPDWFADSTVLPNIVSLRLESCKYCYTLPSLGLLSSLKSLFIEEFDVIVTVGAEFFGGNSCTVPFVSLETLGFKGMENWEEWDCTTTSGAFPCLKVLSISGCPKLKGNLPQQLASLEDLLIEDSPQLVASMPSAPLIRSLTLENCEHVRLEYAPSTLTTLWFRGPCSNVSLLEMIEHTINNSPIENVKILNCPD